MNPSPSQIRRVIRETKKKDSRPSLEGYLEQLVVFLKKIPAKNAGKKFNTGAVPKSPPHRAWVKTVIVRQAVLLALDHGSPKPSQDSHPSGV